MNEICKRDPKEWHEYTVKAMHIAQASRDEAWAKLADAENVLDAVIQAYKDAGAAVGVVEECCPHIIGVSA